MKTAFGRVITITAALGVIGAAVVVLGYRLLVKSLPDPTDAVAIAGLEQNAEILWDSHGIPHIRATSTEDLHRIAGYAAARDRLWQMDFNRRAAAGTLSEIFGEATLRHDRTFRTWGFTRVAEANLDVLSDESRRALSAYAAGVNAYIESHQTRLPLEFSLLGYRPSPWRMTDSISSLRLLAFALSYAWHAELAQHAIAQRVGTRRAAELFPGAERGSPTISAQGGRAAGMLLAAIADARRFAGLGAVPGASNSWAVSGARSKSGFPLLANDPHLDFRMPAIWYEMDLQAPGYQVAGATLPGVPGVLIGQNRAAAWGLTNGMVDDMDFYVERLDPRNPDRYRDGSNWRPFEIVQERIEVKGRAQPDFLEIRISRHGPVISDIHPLHEADSLVLSVQWTGHLAGDDLAAIFSINRATSWEAFKAAAAGVIAPVQNLLYADTSGTIGYTAAGRVPVRKDGRGGRVYEARSDDGVWTGFVPAAKLPAIRNPKSGFLATANNRMAPAGYRFYLGNGWDGDSRIRRVTALIQEDSLWSVAGFAAMQTDLYSNHAARMQERVGPALAAATLARNDARVRALLMNWDFHETPESPEPAIFHAFFTRLTANCIGDEVGPEVFAEYSHWTNFAIRAMERLTLRPKDAWWDDVRTPEKESMAEIVEKSFSEAVALLTDGWGDGPGYWEWGRVHQATLRHPISTGSPLGRVLDSGPHPVGGSSSTISKTAYRLTNVFDAFAGATLRSVVDLARMDRRYSIIAGGQSGQPMSDQYADQVAKWREGELKTIYLDDGDLLAGGAIRQSFSPAQ